MDEQINDSFRNYTGKNITLQELCEIFKRISIALYKKKVLNEKRYKSINIENKVNDILKKLLELSQIYCPTMNQ